MTPSISSGHAATSPGTGRRAVIWNSPARRSATLRRLIQDSIAGGMREQDYTPEFRPEFEKFAVLQRFERDEAGRVTSIRSMSGELKPSVLLKDDSTP